MDHIDLISLKCQFEELNASDKIEINRKRRVIQKLLFQFHDESLVPLDLVKNNQKVTFDENVVVQCLEMNQENVSNYSDNSLIIKEEIELKSILRRKSIEHLFENHKKIEIKNIGAKMRQELIELGMNQMEISSCSKCDFPVSSNQLFVDFNSNKSQNNFYDDVKCSDCLINQSNDSINGVRSLFQVLAEEISQKWASNLRQHFLEILDHWPPHLDAIITEIRKDILTKKDIIDFLKSANDPEEFREACEVLISTGSLFLIEYHDFRASCRILEKIRENVNSDDYHQLFSIYFETRTKSPQV